MFFYPCLLLQLTTVCVSVCFRFLTSLFFFAVLSAQASPSSVLHSSKTKLHCDAETFVGTFWWSNDNVTFKPGKSMVVESVTSDDKWRCIIKDNNGKEMLQLEVKVSVVGMFPLMALPCYECKSQLCSTHVLYAFCV